MSLGLYGIVLGGWSTRSTLPLYGAVRSSAQVISYELAMGLSLVSVFLMSGSMSTSQIVAAQGQFWWAFTLFPAFVIYCISAVGEVNRLPFDLPEAEGEIVAGHMTEYSSMKFGWYYLSEYVNMLNVSAVATTMFFGGWHAPWPLSHVEFLNSGWWGLLWFFLKIWFFMFLLIWTRATLLRFRYDQFMNLGWKRLMPIALGWLVLVALVRGITQFVALPNHVLFGGVGVIFLIALVIIWLTDKGEPEEIPASEREYTGFEDGFPVPPLPGQTPVASPRARATIEAHWPRPRQSTTRRRAPMSEKTTGEDMLFEHDPRVLSRSSSPPWPATESRWLRSSDPPSPSSTRANPRASCLASTVVTSSTATTMAWRSASAASCAPGRAPLTRSSSRPRPTPPTSSTRRANATGASTRSTTCAASSAACASRRAPRAP